MDYDQKVLRKLQLTQLEILKDIDVFCKKNKITYMLAYGTLIGAVPRADYQKFLKLAKEGMKEKYDILNIYETPGYISPFLKVSRKGTEFVEATNSNPRYHHGIFVDVFPLDYAANDEKTRNRNRKLAWFWAKVCILCEISDPIIGGNVTGNEPNMSKVRKTIAKYGCKFAHGILRLIRFDKVKAYRKHLRYAAMFDRRKDQRKYLADFCGSVPHKTNFLASDMLPAKPVSFEGYEFMGPNHTDGVLKTTYGDYMKLPPEDKRHNHMAKKLVFADENNTLV